MAAGAVTLDFSKTQPLDQGGGVSLDFSKAEPLTPSLASMPGARPKTLDSGEGPIARNLTSFETQLANTPRGVGGFLRHTFLPTHEEVLQERAANEEEMQKPALTQLGNAVGKLNPIATVDRGTPNEHTDIGATAANLLPLTIDMRGGGIGKSPAGEATRATVPPAVRTIARATNAALEKAPGTIGGAIGAGLGHATGLPGGGEIGAVGGAVIGRSVLPKIHVPGESFGLPKPLYPGAPLPANPITEGEYVEPPAQQIAKPSTAPLAHAEVVPPKMLPASASVARELPYRMGPGQITPEDVNAPNPRILGGNKGRIVTMPSSGRTAGLLGTGETAAETTPLIATPKSAPTSAMRLGNAPETLSGESALRQILTGQDNQALLKIAKSRGVNVTKEAQLKPGVGDKLLVDKIIDDFSPDELEGIRGQYLENNRFRHDFGDIGPEAWKTMGLQSYFPDLKIAGARLARTQKAIASPTPPEDLTGVLERSVAAAKQRRLGQ